MVGLVIVTHSPALAKGVVETCRMMAKDARIATAGGMENGAFGTSYARIIHAIDAVYGADGVVILVDAGSSIRTRVRKGPVGAERHFQTGGFRGTAEDLQWRVPRGQGP